MSSARGQGGGGRRFEGGPSGRGHGSGPRADRGRRGPPSIYSPPGRTTQIDARLRDGTQNDLLQAFKSVNINDNDLPLRPGYGEGGRQVALRTNYFPVAIPKGSFYEYQIDIAPVVTSKLVRRRIFELAEDTQVWQSTLTGSVVHDHSAKLVSRHHLPQPLTICVPWYNEGEYPPAPGSSPQKKYTLTLDLVRVLEMDNLERYIVGDPQCRDYDIMPIVSAFNLILAAYATRLGSGAIMVGRNRLFFPTVNPLSLGGGLEAAHGFYSSVRTAHKQLMVNVDVCTTTFYKPGNLAVFLIEFMRRGYSEWPSTFVKGLRIKTTHLGHRKTITKMTEYTANCYKFETGEFGEICVADYFLRRYNIALKYPDLPLVDVGGQRVFPAELCEILPNQPFRGKPLEEHTAFMTSYASNPPNVNAEAIESRGLRQLGFAQGAPTLAAFGVGIGTEMATVPGRILAPPKPKYFQNVDGSDFKSHKGSWNLKKVQFTRGAPMKKWAVLVIHDDNQGEFRGPTDPELLDTLNGFVVTCQAMGIAIKSRPKFAEVVLPPKNRTEDPTRSLAINGIQGAMSNLLEQKPEIIMIILSSDDRHIYSGLKRLCDITLDVATVCVQSSKFRTGGPIYCANVALKVNIKLGGANHTLDENSMRWFREKPTMLVGMDATHPGPGSVKGTPSIAAVAASCDGDFIQFPASLRMQESKKEMITDLEDMMFERLKVFQSKNDQCLPDRVLVYRDGVSEGQYRAIMEQEVPLIHGAFRRIDVNYRPKLTIVICGKRHHTRFFPTQQNDADDKANPLPGTVVDRGITSVYHFDFYLQAHGTLHSSSRFTHYFVVYDEIGFTPDELQSLTNNICYMFARATKAVSLASPAYYAHLACERGRCYLHEMLQGIRKDGNTLASGDEEQIRREAVDYWGRGPTGPNTRDIMFYL